MKKTTITLMAGMLALGLWAQEKDAALPALGALAEAKDVAAQASATTKAHEAEMEVAEETAAEEPLEVSEAEEVELAQPATTKSAAVKSEAKSTPAPAATAQQPASETKPVAATTTQSAATANAAGLVNGQRMVDEVDLEEDDAALAARRPKVKSADGSDADALVDIDCDDATLADILRQFRKTTGRNIISSESTNLQRRVSVTLRNVPWYQALTAILQSRGFRLDKNGSIYRVVEDRQAIKLNTRSYQLKHASARELADLFNKTYGIKDNNGKVIHQIATCFESANVVVVTAEDKTLSACSEIIEAVDKAVAQIYIEARFLELSSEALHKLGLDWSALSSWQISAKNMAAGWENNFGRLNDFGTQKEYTKKNMVKTGGSTSDSNSDSKTISATEPSSSSSSSSSTSDKIGRASCRERV